MSRLHSFIDPRVAQAEFIEHPSALSAREVMDMMAGTQPIAVANDDERQAFIERASSISPAFARRLAIEAMMPFHPSVVNVTETWHTMCDEPIPADLRMAQAACLSEPRTGSARAFQEQTWTAYLDLVMYAREMFEAANSPQQAARVLVALTRAHDMARTIERIDACAKLALVAHGDVCEATITGTHTLTLSTPCKLKPGTVWATFASGALGRMKLTSIDAHDHTLIADYDVPRSRVAKLGYDHDVTRTALAQAQRDAVGVYLSEASSVPDKNLTAVGRWSGAYRRRMLPPLVRRSGL